MDMMMYLLSMSTHNGNPHGADKVNFPFTPSLRGNGRFLEAEKGGSCIYNIFNIYIYNIFIFILSYYRDICERVTSVFFAPFAHSFSLCF